MKVKRGYNKEQIIAERQNNVSSDVEELEEDLTIEPQNPERPFMNEEDYTDSDGSIYFRNSRKRRRILESETSDEEDLLDIRQHQRSPIWYTEKDNEFSSTPPPFVSPFEIKITGETPYEYFKNIFTDEIFEYIVRETIRYAVDCGKHSFHITVSDRMVAHYPHSLKNKKFYHRIAFQFLNISITNSWILFNYDKKKQDVSSRIQSLTGERTNTDR